jgi:integrase
LAAHEPQIPPRQVTIFTGGGGHEFRHSKPTSFAGGGAHDFRRGPRAQASVSNQIALLVLHCRFRFSRCAWVQSFDSGEVASLRNRRAIWQLVIHYARATSLGKLAPHDLRRTCAKLCRKAGGDLEQIQLLLGHASIQTIERYLGTEQDLSVAVNDGLGLEMD